jgi:hypothetical protein
MILAVETKVLGENLPQRHFVHHKSHLPDPGANPGRRIEKPATNRLQLWRGTPWNRVLPEKLIKKLLACIITRSLFRCSQDSTTALYLNQINPIHSHPILQRRVLILSFHLCLGLSRAYLCCFPTKILV